MEQSEADTAPILRRPAAADCAALTKMCLRSKQSNGYDDAFMAACAAELTITPEQLDRSMFWMAARDDAVLGCAAVSKTQTVGQGEVGMFFVDPSAQGQGVGRLLWQAMLRDCKTLKLDSLVLNADPAAVGFYTRLGFVEIGRKPSGSIVGRTLPHMHLCITQ